MTKYRLIENTKTPVQAIIYECVESPDILNTLIYLVREWEEEEDRICIGGHISETKRGWTIKTLWLTNKEIKIFLPREAFTKVNLT